MLSKRRRLDVLPVELAGRIPQEIFDIIIRTVPDFHTARSCSLVCKAWSSTCRLRFFSQATLDRDYIDFLAKAGENILPCIRSLNVESEYKILLNLREDHCKKMLSLVPRMSRLTSLELVGCHDAEIARQFSAKLGANVELTTLKLGMLSIVSLEECLKCVGFFGPGLQRLELGFVAGAGMSLGDEVCLMDPVLLKLATVNINPCSVPMLHWLASSRTSIRSCKLYWWATRVEDLSALEAFTNVENLTLHFRSFDPSYRSLDQALGPFPKLKTLFIELSREDPGKDYVAASLGDAGHGVPWYIAFLSGAVSTLSCLTLQIFFRSEQELDRMEWGLLNDLLRQLPAYAALEELCFQVRWPYPPEEADRWIRSRVDVPRSNFKLKVERCW
ncbi:hypothetical protein D9611_006523 [Ephemerocybe angulata]|uniref:F-box domain-containing protein n=1 Tax=Ephemerocybe angulata TaxID=980116 RepID=A0A8H5C8B0_9AGAR|nr:hypothetical protein D9611_006523 [Tulosesus angulatus]